MAGWAICKICPAWVRCRSMNCSTWVALTPSAALNMLISVPGIRSPMTVSAATSFIQLNQEIRFPLYKKLGLMGTRLFRRRQRLRPKGWRSHFCGTTVGTGIRWFSPMGPLRVEWGYNLTHKNGENKPASGNSPWAARSRKAGGRPAGKAPGARPGRRMAVFSSLSAVFGYTTGPGNSPKGEWEKSRQNRLHFRNYFRRRVFRPPPGINLIEPSGGLNA